MKADTFLDNFNQVANAPDGVQQIRALVFQLAALGQLVRPIESEGDAESLLAKIELERDRLLDSGDIKRDTKYSAIEPSPQLSLIPNHWRWTRLGKITSKIGSGSTPRGGSQVYKTKGIPFLRSQNIWNDGIRLDDVVYIDSQIHEDMRNTHVLPNDILLNITGASLGRCASVPSGFPPANVSQHVTIIRPLLPETRNFVRICLLAPFGQGMIWGRQVGMAREGLSKKVLEQFEIPLPPLKEQGRIVAKVNELMALCDRLETQQQERQKLFPVLSRASHDRFTHVANPDNLDRIFGSIGEISPGDLRKTVLSIAVQGKLLPQDGREEAVEKTLAENDAKRQEIARRDKRADNDNQSLLSADDQWGIPRSWAWRGLADLVLFVDYRGKTPIKVSSGIRLLTAKNIKKGEINLSPEEFLSEPDYQSWMTRGLPRQGDVLFTTEAPMGNAAVVELTERFALAQRVICFQCYGAINSDFLVIQILSENFQFILDKNGTGVTAKGIKASKLKRLSIAVPPLAEQRRIVAKVDQLMALIDTLEKQQQARDHLAETFAKAVVASLTGTQIAERKEKMKAPKTELISTLQLGAAPKSKEDAPLATLLLKANGELSAKSLWEQSRLPIDAFYQQLKTELTRGWIAPPKKATMQELEET